MEWISVKANPIKYERYLGYLAPRTEADVERYAIVHWTDQGWLKSSGNRADDIWNVLTHWMPLPPPPNTVSAKGESQ